MQDNSNPNCDLVFTGDYFNNKPVYMCNYCKMKIGLENPDVKMLCFKKMQDFTVSIKKIYDPNFTEPTEAKSMEAIQDIVLDQVIKNYGQKQNDPDDSPENLCSQEEIKTRLDICKTCEHYKDDSCLLCGCVIIREKNYMNKLAHRNQKCPIGKWNTINNQT